MPPKSNLLQFPKRLGAATPSEGKNPDYEQLLRDLIEEHKPADAVELALVQQMAQQRELMDRWLVLQQRAFAMEAVSKDLPMIMRQQAAAERSFHVALSTLIKFRKRPK